MKFVMKKPSPDNCKYHMMNDKTIYPGVHTRMVELSPDHYKYNIRDDKTIYLGVQTNIVCVDDRSEEIGSCMKKGHLLLYI